MKVKPVKQIMEISKDAKTDVMRVHNLFWESYARRDIELRFSLCAEDVTFIGSGLHERALNKTEYRNINHAGVKQYPDPFQIEFLWTNLTMLNENVACVESEVVWSQPIKDEISKELLRNTTLLKYDNKKWLITHVHGSVPDYRLKDGDYMTNEQTIIRNRELERQVFERTQDLNNTLKELELKNRELEIETALEKVRSSALAMKEPSDMVEVCRIISDQLQILGVNNIRNVQTAIIYEQKSTYLNYQYFVAYDKSVIEEAEYNKHPKAREMAETMHKSAEAFFSQSFDGEELKVFREYRKQDNQLRDPILDEVTALHFYFYSIGPGALGLSTYNFPLSENELNILKRFRNVFELAYRRFVDIEQAIAQAREAQIEAALERVRAKAMAMHTSNDLTETMGVLFTELPKLGITSLRCGVVLLSKDSQRGVFYAAAITPESDSFTMIGEGDMTVHPVFENQYRYWLKNENYFTTLRDEELQSYYEALFARLSVPYKPRDHKVQTEHGYYFAFSAGMFYVWAEDPYSDAYINILNRFKAIIDLTFRRYLDLQKAEAQAREAQIELALERVRARTMAMQKSEELKEVIRIVYQQLTDLKIKLDHSGFVVDYTPGGDWHFWIADEQDIPSKITHPYFESVWANQFNEAKEKGMEFFATNLNFEEKNKFYNELLSYVPGLPEASKDFYLSCPGLAATTVLFDSVSLYIENFSGIPYSDEENKILMRFGKVFQQTYTRFLDLQKAEAQAREAKIEASLEKVRAAAMSMHKSEELLNVSEILYDELLKLGFEEMRNAMINIHNDYDKTFLNYDYSDEIGKSVTLLNYNSHPQMEKQIKQSRIADDAFSEAVYQGKDLDAWKEFRKKYGEKDDPRINSISALYYYFYSIGNGTIGISTFSPIGDEKLSLLKRFRNVFNLAYRRYSDLALAEAQAREAQIEVSLERVRSKAMSMHSPNDLSETVNVFFKELKTLGIIPIRCGVGQIDDTTRTTNLTTTTSSQQGESFRVIGKVKQTGHPVLDGIFDHWKLQKEYHPVLEGADIKAYYNVMNPQIGYPDYPEGVTQYGNSFPFKEGFIFAWTENKLSEEELGIFRRFASVLSLTYRRYLDLKEAEERNKIIQAENDRKTKELEEARQLQLSLLPKAVPKLPHLNIAVYMKTATEVGGDYYDFNIQENGILNIGFGDATGHGLQAGTMITLMKGFFTSDVARFTPHKFLEHCNGMIRDIKLGRILMSFSHLRFEDKRLLISSAGMPPVYFHNKKNNRAEEIIIQGLPLGAMRSASYKLVEKELNIGDTILLLTDGLPEQMNKANVIFDYSRVLKYFGEIVDNSPDKIISTLVKKSDEWISGTKQADDMTFVVIRVI